MGREGKSCKGRYTWVCAYQTREEDRKGIETWSVDGKTIYFGEQKRLIFHEIKNWRVICITGS